MRLLELLVDLASMGRCRSTHHANRLRCRKEAGHCGFHLADGKLGMAGIDVHIWPGDRDCPSEYPAGPWVEDA